MSTYFGGDLQCCYDELQLLGAREINHLNVFVS